MPGLQGAGFADNPPDNPEGESALDRVAFVEQEIRNAKKVYKELIADLKESLNTVRKAPTPTQQTTPPTHNHSSSNSAPSSKTSWPSRPTAKTRPYSSSRPSPSSSCRCPSSPRTLA